VCSDLHIEFQDSDSLKVEDFVTPSAKYIALLGDIGVVHQTARYRAFLLAMAERFERVLVLLGNHEFYRNSSVEETLETVRKICAERPDRLLFMHRHSVLIDNVRVVGTTLWSKGRDEYKHVVGSCLADYYQITVADGKRLRVADTIRWHEEELGFVQQELEKARVAGEPVVVLSHHSPVIDHGTADAQYVLRRSKPSRFRADHLLYSVWSRRYYYSEASGGFSSDLAAMLAPPIRVWAYGHTHWYRRRFASMPSHRSRRLSADCALAASVQVQRHRHQQRPRGVESARVPTGASVLFADADDFRAGPHRPPAVTVRQPARRQY
jgi:hypothetical protein